jgi:DNA-directed RNA polymerase subunit RPC12/RpoP
VKKLSEVNEERYEHYRQQQERAKKAHLTGIACDECGTELHYLNPELLLMSSPPKRDVHCPQCGFRGYKVC